LIKKLVSEQRHHLNRQRRQLEHAELNPKVGPLDAKRRNALQHTLLSHNHDEWADIFLFDSKFDYGWIIEETASYWIATKEIPPFRHKLL
jgi:hypothetical protein